jgi:prepilin-type processing-associated H-X9-DG protein
MYVYSFDYDDTLPTGDQWCDLLMDEADVGAKSLVCPSGSAGECHYAMNENAIKLDASMLSDMVLLFEVSAPGWNLVGGPEMLSTENHNGDGCNVLFGDGHTEFVRSGEIDRLRWSADEDEMDENH